MNYINLSDSDVKGLVHEIIRQINSSRYKPDYIVGITRGGLIPAVMLSHYLQVPMHTLNVSLRDNALGPESNLWMAEDAFGYPKQERTVDDPSDVGSVLEAASDLLELNDNYKNILIVDDINDSGETFNWIMNDWQSGCLPNDPEWNNVWNVNVKFAVLVDNLSSKCRVKMDFVGREIDKQADDWVVFPYESWWR